MGGLKSSYEVLDTERRAAFDAVWEMRKASVRLRHVVLPDDVRVFLQVRVLPREPVKEGTIVLYNYPAGFAPYNARRLAVGPEPLAKREKLDLKRHWWCFYHDTIQDRAFGRGEGASGLVIVPEELRSHRYGIGGHTRLKFGLKPPGEVTCVHLVLYTWPDVSNEEALSELRRTAAESRERVTGVFGGLP